MNSAQEYYQIVKDQNSSLSLSELCEKLSDAEKELSSRKKDLDENISDGLEFVLDERRAISDLIDVKTKYFNISREAVSHKENNRLKLLLANFKCSKQKKDIEKRTAVISDFFRIKIDVKPFQEEDFDWSNPHKIMKAMATGFDMPSWALYALEGVKALDARLKPYNEIFIYQLKGCNLRCIYCFVDDFNKKAVHDEGSKYFSISEIVDEFERENDRRKSHNKEPLRRIRASGGEPTLVIEQWLILLKELEKRGLSSKVYLQSETNLTTGHFIDRLIKERKLDKFILNEIAQYKNFGLLCSFKGTDKINFHANTRLDPDLFKEQIYSFKRVVDAGIDAYPFFYNPNPRTLERFLEELATNCGEKIYLRSWVFPLKVYEPVRDRLRNRTLVYERKWQKNFERAEEKMEEILKKRGLEYKKV